MRGYLKSHHLLLLCAIFVVISLCGTVSAADNTKCVSISSNGTQSNSYSYDPSISADGRYVVFSSNADNLVENDTNYYQDIFVHDLVSNITERVSISSDSEEANGDCYNPSISGDGRYITFNSYANNLVLNDKNNLCDIFVYDRILKNTTRISISTTGEEADGDSFEASISSDGCYVVFTSYATNLVPNDSNNFGDIFMYNMNTSTIKRVSVNSKGGETNSDSFQPAISADGRFITFTSYADNLVNDNNVSSDVFVYDQTLNTIIRVSVSNNGEEGNFNSEQPSISGDGNYIVFTSYADNLSPDDENYKSDIFVYNQVSKKIERVSFLKGREITKNSHSPAISANGRYIIFAVGETYSSIAMVSVNNFNVNEYGHGLIFVHDILLGSTDVVSVSNNGEIANRDCNEPVINADGSYVAFSSYADNLVPNDGNYSEDVFVRIINSSHTPFHGSILPNFVKSGDIIVIKAYSDDAIDVAALIFNETLNLTKQADGTWLLNYNVPNTSNGIYVVLLAATYISGNSENLLLNFTVDNTLPTISGIITPNVAKSGDLIIVIALSDPDTTNIWVSICGEILKMDNNGDDTWILYYYVPIKPDGNYPVLMSVKDKVGNQNTYLLNLTIDNTSPSISASLSPETIKSFEKLTITAYSDSDTASIKALIFNHTYDLVKQNDNVWTLNYTVPNMPDDVYDIFLTATDNVGNKGPEHKLNFGINNPIDNVTPTISAIVTPKDYKKIHGIFPRDPIVTIKAFSDPDTANITALILNQNFNMTRQLDGSWILYYSVFGLSEDTYSILLTAKDISGNIGTLSTNFTISNLNPVINATINPGKVKSGNGVTIIVSSDLNAEKVNMFDFDNKLVYFIKQSNGSWKYNFIVPNLKDNTYCLGINFNYGYGIYYDNYHYIISGQHPVYLTVDNTPPVVSGSVSPGLVKSGDVLRITVYSNIWRLDDTASLTATIFGQTFNMPKSNYLHGSRGEINYVVHTYLMECIQSS